MARVRGADRQLVAAILREKRADSSRTAAEIARRVHTSPKTASRVLRVMNRRQRESLADIAAAVQESETWVGDVLDVWDQVQREPSPRQAPPAHSRDLHMLDLARAARRLSREVELRAGLVHRGWPPPGKEDWALEIEQDLPGRCLVSHLSDHPVGKDLNRMIELGQQFSRGGWAIVGALQERYSPSSIDIEEGLTYGFAQSVYSEAILRARAGLRKAARCREEETDGIWFLWRRNFAIARSRDRSSLGAYEELHREAIASTLGNPELGAIVSLAEKISDLGTSVRGQLSILALKRQFPGRCEACPEP
jgi:hypothetical protein